MSIQNLQLRYRIINIPYIIGTSLFGAMIYIYMDNLGYNLTSINIFILLFYLVSFITEIPAGVLSDTFGRRNIDILGSSLRGLGLFVLFLSNGGITSLIFAAIFTSLGSSLGGMTAWLIDSIQAINKDYNFEKFFSNNAVIFTSISMIFTFLGARIFASINLALPILLSAIMLFVSSFVTFFLVKNDREKRCKENNDIKPFEEYSLTLKNAIKFLKENKFILLIFISFLGSSFLTTLPSYHWQLYFVNGDEGVFTAGYISIFISISSIIGAFVAPRLKLDKKGKILFLIFSSIFNAILLILSVIFENIILSLSFFFLHIAINAIDSFLIGIYLISVFQKDNRRTLGAFYSTMETIIVILVILFNSIWTLFLDLGEAWIVMAIISMIFSLPLLILVYKRQKEISA